MAATFDAIVIGGGIVGLSTALALVEEVGLRRLLVLEREQELGRHQTGHNSGVIHAGVYYQPGSLKARLCRQGLTRTKQFCRERELPWDECGKLVVATDETELERMAALAARATVNGVKIERLSGAELVREEPGIVGTGALLVPETGITDYRRIALEIARLIEAAGGTIRCRSPVSAITEGATSVRVRAGAEAFEAPIVVACAGLWADRVLARAGIRPDFRIVPFRGSYYRLRPRATPYARRLIYPVPDPATPFLGVHLTRMVDGSFTVGPNAALSWSRTGYRWYDVSVPDLTGMLGFPGFWRLVRRLRATAIDEIRTAMSRHRYLARVQRYCPSITAAELLPHPAGVRAQAVDREGRLIDDFLFRETDRMVHVCNAPSPAATSALPIGSLVAERVRSRL
jgi:L-2-hydroxyglutarate oxidase